VSGCAKALCTGSFIRAISRFPCFYELICASADYSWLSKLSRLTAAWSDRLVAAIVETGRNFRLDKFQISVN
jgi:hypothetical protein